MSITDKYKYKYQYVDNLIEFKERIINRTFIPSQVEIQPGPLGAKICWLSCSYCYGRSAVNTEERMSLPRYLEIIEQIIEGGCKKLIFAGWATDPLFYKHIDDLVELSVKRNAVVGFNTRAIELSDKLADTLTDDQVASSSYMSISVNAATNEKYNLINSSGSSTAKLYDRVLGNVRKLSSARRQRSSKLDISVSYLLNRESASVSEVSKFIDDYVDSDVDIIRFSCAQSPRGFEDEQSNLIPDEEEYKKLCEPLQKLIESKKNEKTRIILLDRDPEFHKARTLPCFARFIYPTIGYDGWLYHCSQSAGVNFRTQSLGDLKKEDFWPLLRNYEVDNLEKYFTEQSKLMCENNCRCDRKEHATNASIISSEIFR